jgi:hypothetical protein
MLAQQLDQRLGQADRPAAGSRFRISIFAVAHYPIRTPAGELSAATAAAVLVDRPKPRLPDPEQARVKIDITPPQSEH